MREAMRIADRSALSRAQLVEKLARRGFDESDCEDAAARLTQLGALDDAAFARSICSHYESRGYGAGRISRELSKRGIDRDTAALALRELPAPDGAIRRYLEAHLPAQPSRADFDKARAALFRRGFSWEDIRRALRDPEDD